AKDPTNTLNILVILEAIAHAGTAVAAFMGVLGFCCGRAGDPQLVPVVGLAPATVPRPLSDAPPPGKQQERGWHIRRTASALRPVVLLSRDARHRGERSCHPLSCQAWHR